MASFRRQSIASGFNKQSYYPLSKSVTEIPVKNFFHLWTIKNFTLISSDAEYICSPNFHPFDSTDKWFMKLRTKCIDDATRTEYIGVHLFLRSCEDENKQQVRAKYIIKILDDDGDTRFYGECSKVDGRIFKAGVEGHGYRLLAPRPALLDGNILGNEDTLQILCEVTVIEDMVSSLMPQIETNLYTENELNTGCFADDFGKLSKCLTESDVVVESNDGVLFKAHKLLLKTRSNVFAAMLNYDTVEKAQSKIHIPDFDSAVISELINFIYTDNVDQDTMKDVAGELLIAADKYDIPRLKCLCEQFMADNLTSDTCGYLLNLSDSCSCEKLKKKVMEFVAANPLKAVNDAWETQVGKRPYLYKEMLKELIKKQKKA